MARSSDSQVDDIKEDHISHLPDDVLVNILSLLSLKQAGRTSVLAKRWRHMWKFTRRLNFDDSQVPFNLLMSSSSRRYKFLALVNHVVRAHRGPSIDEFRLVFRLDARFSHDIEEWIRFMIQKRAKLIEIDLGYHSVDQYAPSRDCCNYIKSLSNKPNLAFLINLTLNSVDVDGEFLECLLAVCPHLEMLSVSKSDRLVSLKVAGPSLPLKYLKISDCWSIENIELRTPKLVSFFYCGRKVNSFVGSNPLLVDFYVGGESLQEVTHALVPFSCHLAQIETLTLDMTWQENYEYDVNLPPFGELSNLNHLMVKLNVESGRSLIGLTKFIEAAPLLTKFTLKLSWYCDNQLPISEPLIRPHRCLKEVEIFGHNGSSRVFEVVRYLLKNATNLEKMVIDPFRRDKYYQHEDIVRQISKLREDARVLQKSVPPGVELVINDECPWYFIL